MWIPLRALAAMLSSFFPLFPPDIIFLHYHTSNFRRIQLILSAEQAAVFRLDGAFEPVQGLGCPTNHV